MERVQCLEPKSPNLSFVDLGCGLLKYIGQGLIPLVSEFSDLRLNKRGIRKALGFKPLLVLFVGLSEIMPG